MAERDVAGGNTPGEVVVGFNGCGRESVRVRLYADHLIEVLQRMYVLHDVAEHEEGLFFRVKDLAEFVDDEVETLDIPDV